MPTPAPLPPPLSDAELARLDRLVAQMVHGEATRTEWPAHDLAHAAPRLLADLRRCRAALVRLSRGEFTPDEFQALCHHRDERPGCTRADFEAGCRDYQEKLFGCAGSGLHPAALAALGDDAGAGGAT